MTYSRRGIANRGTPPGFVSAGKRLPPPSLPCLPFFLHPGKSLNFGPGRERWGKERGGGGRDALPAPPLPPPVLSACGRSLRRAG